MQRKAFLRHSIPSCHDQMCSGLFTMILPLLQLKSIELHYISSSSNVGGTMCLCLCLFPMPLLHNRIWKKMEKNAKEINQLRKFKWKATRRAVTSAAAVMHHPKQPNMNNCDHCVTTGREWFDVHPHTHTHTRMHTFPIRIAFDSIWRRRWLH